MLIFVTLLNQDWKMDRKEIQEQRMKGYFLQAAKEMIKGEGLKSISVRNVADRAGYSYATLYNYFKDLKDLVFLCVKDFQEECRRQVENTSKKAERGLPKIREIVKSYAKFYVQYPGIFELFFIERLNDLGGKQPVTEMIYSFLTRLCADEWAYCIAEDIVSAEDAEKLKKELNYSVHGLLLFYINRRQPPAYEQFTADLEKAIDGILDNK